METAPATCVDPGVLAGWTDDELTDTLDQLVAIQGAFRRLVLQLIVEYREREAWKPDAAPSMESWLCTRYHLDIATAREWVRIGERLEEQPAIAAAFFRGEIWWDQLRVVMRFATPERDEEIAREAPSRSTAQLRAYARHLRRITREEAVDRHAQRSVRWWWTSDGMLHLKGRLPDADGATVVKAIERAAEPAPRDLQTGDREPFEARCADALVQLAGARLAADRDADRATVVVHADVGAVADGDGFAQLANGPDIGSETLRRLMCHGRIEWVWERDGHPIGIGRAGRAVPAWLERQVRHRDQGCRYPGCPCTNCLHVHHKVHVAHGGATDLHNLFFICGPHHRRLHEGGWRVDGDPEGKLRFIAPDGRVLRSRPPPLRPGVARDILGPRSGPPPEQPLPEFADEPIRPRDGRDERRRE